MMKNSASSAMAMTRSTTARTRKKLLLCTRKIIIYFFKNVFKSVCCIDWSWLRTIVCTTRRRWRRSARAQITNAKNVPVAIVETVNLTKSTVDNYKKNGKNYMWLVWIVLALHRVGEGLALGFGRGTSAPCRSRSRQSRTCRGLSHSYPCSCPKQCCRLTAANTCYKLYHDFKRSRKKVVSLLDYEASHNNITPPVRNWADCHLQSFISRIYVLKRYISLYYK